MSYRAGVALKLKIFSCRLRISCIFPSLDEFKRSYWYVYLTLPKFKVLITTTTCDFRKSEITKKFIQEMFFSLFAGNVYVLRCINARNIHCIRIIRHTVLERECVHWWPFRFKRNILEAHFQYEGAFLVLQKCFKSISRISEIKKPLLLIHFQAEMDFFFNFWHF